MTNCYCVLISTGGFKGVRPDQKVCSKFTIWYHMYVIIVRFPYLPICWWKSVRRRPCLPDEIMTLWLLRMWIADDMETIVEWQTTVTREMGDVGQTWKWGPRAKSYYVVSLYWDPHTYMWTSNQNLNRVYFSCSCKICFEKMYTLDRLSFYTEPTATYTQCMGHGTTPENCAGSGDVLRWSCGQKRFEIGDDVLAKCNRAGRCWWWRSVL